MSTPDENKPMHQALQRDAAGVPKPDFDPALHYATMRRLRSLAGTPTPMFRPGLALAAAAAVLLVIVSFAFWPTPPSSGDRVAAQSAFLQEHPGPAMPRTSLLTYQIAANQGDDALSALLDRDARDLLPASSPIFKAPFN